MPTTVEEYMEQTQALINRGEIDEAITPASAILDLFHTSSMVGGGYIFLPDFGFLVCWCRLDLTAQEFDADSPPLWKYTEEQLRERRAAAEAGFDDLLEQFVRHGYEPAMGERLLQIGNDNFHECEFERVYVLPGDLDAVLDAVGNPLSNDDDIDEDFTAEEIGFDLNNPEHRQKLADRLNEASS